MEVLGLILGLLGLIFTYIWKTNGKLQKEMMQALERIEEGAVKIEEGQKDIAQMTKEGQRELAQITKEGYREIAQMTKEGQREIAQMTKEGQTNLAQITKEGDREIAQMLFNQTKILERMDATITAIAA